MADLGAEVIKIEPPGGEHTRNLPPFIDGVSMHFAHLNYGKKSVVLNLKSGPGKNAVTQLVKRCDVLVENWRPGVAKRLGLDYETLAKLRPGLVYCSISGFGQNGPDAKRAAYAPIVEALSGYSITQMKLDGTTKPPTCGMALGDSMTGIWAFSAVQTALLHREWTGQGQYIDVAMIDSMLFVQMAECRDSQLGRVKHRNHAPVRTADGFIVVAPVTEANFHVLVDTLGHREWLEDPRFATNHARSQNWALILSLIEQWTSLRSTEECERMLLQAGVPCARFQSFSDAMRDPQIMARDNFSTLETSKGPLKLPNAPFQMSDMETQIRPSVSGVGENTEEVLAGLLGYSKSEISACRPE